MAGINKKGSVGVSQTDTVKTKVDAPKEKTPVDANIKKVTESSKEKITEPPKDKMAEVSTDKSLEKEKVIEKDRLVETPKDKIPEKEIPKEKESVEKETVIPKTRCKLENPIKPEEPKKMGIFRRMLQTRNLNIDTTPTDNGLLLHLKWGSIDRKFNVLFPEEVWKPLPEDVKSMIIANIAHLSSLEIAIMLKAKKVSYNTSMPLFKSFFTEVLLKCLLYSGDCDSNKNVDYISRLCNLEFSFKGNPAQINMTQAFSEIKEGSVNTMTFGKESLVCFGLCQELGLNPIPVTVIEPDADVVYRNQRIKTFQNKHKYKLISQFEQEFGIKVYKIDSALNDINDYTLWDLDPTDLGWSTQLTQYLFLLLPFNYNFNYKYTIYGNEFSCNAYYYSSEGFKCHPVYDQSPEWVGHMNIMLQNLTGGKAQVTSLVQPIHEIAVAKVLYQRYPQLAKYQTSCHGNNERAKKNRWCTSCSKCARCFIFMKALGYNPELVGLKDMLSLQYKEYYSLFSQSKEICMSGYDSAGLGRDEQLFAFQQAAKRGVEGELIELFKKEFGEEAERREAELKNEFFKVQRPLNVPPNLWKKIKPIFEDELSK